MAIQNFPSGILPSSGASITMHLENVSLNPTNSTRNTEPTKKLRRPPPPPLKSPGMGLISSQGGPSNPSSSLSTTIPERNSPVSTSSYCYTPPMTSPFYNSILSPLCDRLCFLLPLSLHPDHISWCGLLFAWIAFVFIGQKPLFFQYLSFENTIFSGVTFLLFAHRYLISAICWILYSLCDNLDGKQARRLKLSSRSGEFVDHACDSLVVTLACLMWLHLLSPDGFQSWRVIIVLVVGQWPFLSATWGHDIIGRLLLGSNCNGKSIFTVDELNFLAIPFGIFLRYTHPRLWDTSIVYMLGITEASSPFIFSVVTHIAAFLGCTNEILSIGSFCVLCICVGVFLLNIQVLAHLFSLKHLPNLLPGVFFTTTSLWFSPSEIVLIAPFSLICIELIAMRLQLHSTMKYIVSG
ncbi:hypothetical protein IE077_002755 [Cardiosporidium cionae]|uniref:Uncharacterized protein n=1 Tax=Cardiosporidium cionae TaxID=476202 RepID=A0ABQ7JA14_9APIC|nr:hypothetical protein IE077_002755 [Cardiosporidium cionae]|eukprot:KAF8820841.1 hypothetical protein IE077_002755 [Cardiosporidium cionae]